jgi:hypothetical protein
MRSDMSKVIVERPRRRFPLKNGSAYPRGHLENRWAPNFDDAPRTESMGGSYKEKWLNENLRPLVRFLRSRVGRRWDDVHSEIATRISCRSAVQKHVLDHLRDYVVENVHIVQGRVERLASRGYEPPLLSYGMRFYFYVHPETRLLCLAPPARRKRRTPHEVDPDRRVLSNDRELRRIDGIWYAIEVAPLPSDPFARAGCFDVLERGPVGGRVYETGMRTNVLWRTGRYAVRKRQLGAREIARYGLRDRARGTPLLPTRIS